ncbi:hypothetical protein A2U01_0002417 [Trifolium medium]|uniref:Uncharacterized protein n=1 Tax=Trifolium medium TaxID=97028 RepID=A0A392M2Y4_9FABA|nr:hypothetical protein [Trifolium medium]
MGKEEIDEKPREKKRGREDAKGRIFHHLRCLICDFGGFLFGNPGVFELCSWGFSLSEDESWLSENSCPGVHLGR